MTLQEQLERSFGDGPEHPPLDLTLAAGHRALRRRRIGTAVVGAAVLAVVGTGAGMAATSGAPSTQGRDVQVATDAATSSPGDGAGTRAVTVSPGRPSFFRAGNLAAYTEDGSVALAPGAEVLDQVPDPVGLRPQGDSLGLVVQQAGERQWLLLHREEVSRGVAFDPADKGGVTFEEWLDRMVDLEQSSSSSIVTTPNFVQFGQGEVLEPLPGVELIDQQASPDLPTFANPRDRSAVAQVRYDGTVWFVLVRQFPEGGAQVIPTRAAAADGATTVAEFLDWARPAYTAGTVGGSEGLR